MTTFFRRAVFLDRDDTLIVDSGYMSYAGQVRILAGVHEALARLHGAGLALVLVSNQSGVARSLVTWAQVKAIQDRMCELLEPVCFAGFEYCLHHPDENCECRKPKPTMLLRVAARLGLDLSCSVMIGDKESDVVAGNAAGSWSILVLNGRPKPFVSAADFVVHDIRASVDIVLGLRRKDAFNANRERHGG